MNFWKTLQLHHQLFSVELLITGWKPIFSTGALNEMGSWPARYPNLNPSTSFYRAMSNPLFVKHQNGTGGFQWEGSPGPKPLVDKFIYKYIELLKLFTLISYISPRFVILNQTTSEITVEMRHFLPCKHLISNPFGI